MWNLVLIATRQLTVTTAAVIFVQVNGFIAELLVLCITWYRTIGTVLAARRARVRVNMSLSEKLLRDGESFAYCWDCETNILSQEVYSFCEVLP